MSQWLCSERDPSADADLKDGRAECLSASEDRDVESKSRRCKEMPFWIANLRF